VTPHLLSAEAGRHILVNGGNAVDAAIAMVTTQGVVAPETCGIGGDLFAIVHVPGDERPHALNASGRSGSKAKSSTLRNEGHTSVPRDHPLTATIPGCVDGLIALSERFGTRTLAETLEPAITTASEGFAASHEQARSFTAAADTYRENSAVAAFYPGGRPIQAGETVRRSELAATLTAIAEGGRHAFYEGIPGEDILAVLDHVAPADLTRNQAEWVQPISVQIDQDRGWVIGPNSAGYLGPGTLAVFLRTDPPDDPDDPLWWHLLIEAHRSLAWERERLVADPESIELPAGEILSSERLDRAADSISRTHAGTWPTRPSEATGTAYMCVSDGTGLSVSIINSNYRGTGSPFGAERSGFLLHDRGGGFSLEPGHPNELLPGKRPAHTLSPTLWTRGTETSWILGTRGGEIQPQLIATLAARTIVSDQPLSDAQSAPRWSMTEYGRGERSAISLEPGTGHAYALRDLGHDVVEHETWQPGWGPMSIIDRRKNTVRAAADPRVDTTAALVF
jgi:gamma-glutamyltranspeptidase/glutathione hydrolase